MRSKFTVLIGIGLALSPWTISAQSPAAAPAPETATAAAIPPDQQPTKEQLIKLFEVMKVRDQMQSMMKILPAMMQQQMQAQMKSLAPNLPGGDASTPEQQAAAAKMMSTCMEKILKAYSIDDMMDDMAAVYQRHLSRADVDAFIVFYQSPAGRHLLEQQPIIMQEAMPLMMSRMQKAATDLIAEMVKEKQESLQPETPAKDKPTEK